jgi:hypothetical protein
VSESLVRRFAVLGLLPALVLGLAAAGCSSSKRPPKPKTSESPPNTACEASQGCKIWGWCTKKNGECVANGDDQCKNSKACQLGGLCTLAWNRCIARDNGDCSGSEWCKKFGYCDAEDGICKD